MLNLFRSIFQKKPNEKNVTLMPESLVVVTFNSEEIRCKRPEGKEEKIKWNKLKAVIIETTDQGPMLPDVFWLLIGNDMESGCLIPQGATGEKQLIEEMQRKLDGFDNETFIFSDVLHRESEIFDLEER